MSTRIPIISLTKDQLTAIRLCCTYHTNPVAKERHQYHDLLNKLDLCSRVKDFARSAFFAPLDPLLIKYLGRRLYQTDNEHYNSSSNVIRFYDIDLKTREVVLPYTFGRLLANDNLNNKIEFPIHEFEFKGKLRANQVEPIKSLMDQLNKFNTTTVGLPTGFGKTVIGCFISCFTKLLTCILITNVPQITQWLNTYKNFSTGNIWVVGEQPQPPNPDIIICMDERINKIPDNIKKSVGTLIIDEAHSFCTEGRSKCWLSFQPKYLILETATIIRPDDAMERMCYAAAGIWGHYIKSDKKFNIYPVRTGIVPTRSYIRTPWGESVKYSTLLKESLFNETLLKIVIGIVSNNRSRKIFILTQLADHVDHLQDSLSRIKINCVKFYRDMKTHAESMIVIGTIPKMGQAYDQSAFLKDFNGIECDLMIICSTIKKYLTFAQTIGRSMRSKNPPDIYQLIHEDSIFKSHMTICKWYVNNYTNGVINPEIPGSKLYLK